MRCRIAGLVGFVALLLWAPADAAGALEEAERLYAEGNMLEAARLGRDAGTAPGFALAAKAILVDALYVASEPERKELLEQAADTSRAALALDPDHVDAMLGLAMALGHKAEMEDPVSAHVNGYAAEGRELIDRALALAPDDAWANGLLGIWHLQVVRHGGDTLAGSFYDADREEGIRLCERALALDPDVTPIRFGCARSLLDIDRDAYRDRAIRELRKVVRAPADDAADRLIRERAWALIRGLQLAAG